jgi:hypothetical protein
MTSYHITPELYLSLSNFILHILLQIFQNECVHAFMTVGYNIGVFNFEFLQIYFFQVKVKKVLQLFSTRILYQRNFNCSAEDDSLFLHSVMTLLQRSILKIICPGAFLYSICLIP